MIISSDSFLNKSKKENSKEPSSKKINKRIKQIFNSSDNLHNKNTTLTSLSGISMNNEMNEKNKFHNNLGRKGISTKALYDARQILMEKLKNKSKSKDTSYILQEKIIINDSDLNKQNISNNSNISNFNPKKNSSSNSIKSNKKNEEEKNEKIDVNINNYKSTSNNLKKGNKQIKEKENNNITTQLNVIFPKEKIENKHLKTLREVTEERTENYISIEKDINKNSESREKENLENKLKNNENKEIEEIEKVKNKKAKILKRNEFILPQNINKETIVPLYKYISSLNELNNLTNEEKIEKLFENNINLYEELIELKIKNNKLIEELKRKENESNDKFKGYLLEENDKLTKKNNENERIIDYLLQKLNINLLKKERRNISYSDIKKEILFYKPKKKSLNISDNFKKSNNENYFNSSNSNLNSNTKCSSNYKYYIKSEKGFSFNNLIPENNDSISNKRNNYYFKSPSKTALSSNNNEFFDYYGSKGDDRIKTCYACLFGKSNFSKGYSPIICSPKYIQNIKKK